MNKLQYPKGEQVWTSYYDTEHRLRFLLTGKTANRDFYFLYELADHEFRKLGKARTPVELEEKYQVAQKLRGALDE